MISYKSLLLDSWTKFKKNLVLVLPTLLGVLFIMGFVSLLAIEAVVIWAFSKGSFSLETIFILKNLPFLIVFGIIDFIALLLISSYVRAMEIGMLMDITKKGRTSTKNMFLYGKKMMLKYLKVFLLLILIVYVPLAGIAGILYALYALFNLSQVIVIAAISVILLILLVLSWFLFFIEPIIFLKKDNPWAIIKSSFGYTKKNFKHALITWGIVFLVMIAVSIVLSLFENLIESGKGIFFSILVFLFSVFQWAINIVISLVTRLFIFKSYLAKR